ncbi:hypothetical protein F4809DRAFT_72137 [Biscogniauxia mediterranea]|nr:hypothetical protein F4809DRAFT_72137 [Biscogniauxia mediterranea]
MGWPAGSQQRPFQSQPHSQPQTQFLSQPCNSSSLQARPRSRCESRSTIASSSSESYGSIKSLEDQLTQLIIQDVVPSSQLTIQTQSADSSQPLGSQNTQLSTGDVVYPSLPSPSTFFGTSLSQVDRYQDNPASLVSTDESQAQSSSSSADSRLRAALEAFLERKREEELLEMIAESVDMSDDSESEDDEDGRWGRGL